MDHHGLPPHRNALELPNHPDKGDAKSHTPNASPGISQEGTVPNASPATSEEHPQIQTPESSPERGHGGVRLSPAKPSLNAEILPTTILPQVSTERSRQQDDDPEDQGIRSRSMTESQTVDSRGLSSSEGSGLKRRSLTGSARLPPLRLQHHFFSDASRRVSSAERSQGRTTLDGIALGGPPLAPSPTRQENYPPSAAQGAAEPNAYPPQEPPAYQPRPLIIQRSRWDELQQSLPFPNIRDRFWRWFRMVGLDVLFLFIFLALTGIIMLWGKLWRWEERLFPMTFDPYTGTWYGPVEFSYPRHDFILGITTTGIMIPLIPLAVIILTQFWIRSLLDFNAAFFALKKAMVMMLFLQVILKSYIGEFRPFFISQCNPDPVRLDALRQSLAPGMYTPNSPRVFANPTFCRGDPAKSPAQNHKDLIFAMTSFPSGHTSESFMAGTFLALYLNAKLKPFGDFHTSFWKMVAVMAPVIGAMFIAGSLVTDRNHHHHDIILSIPIGVLVAFLAYRTHYASIFNYRTNHLPLPWSGSHESLNSTNPIPQSAQQRKKPARTLKNKGNFVATTWPRKPKTYSYGNNGQENGTALTAQGLDGTEDRASPAVMAAGGRTYRPRLGVVRRARLRMAMFPRADVARNSSLVRSSGAIEPNGQTSFEMRPTVGLDGVASRTRSGRTGVDEWVRATSRMRTGRPSDMV